MVVLFALIAALIMAAFAIVWVIKGIIRDAEARAQGIIKQAKAQVNQFASLSPNELNQELSRVWTNIITAEIIENISEKDSHGEEELYLRGMQRFLEYFSGSMDAINIRYGNDYLIKWFDLHFDVMQAEGAITRLIEATSRKNVL